MTSHVRKQVKAEPGAQFGLSPAGPPGERAGWLSPCKGGQRHSAVSERASSGTLGGQWCSLSPHRGSDKAQDLGQDPEAPLAYGIVRSHCREVGPTQVSPHSLQVLSVRPDDS